jgi:pyridoxal phosphate enzyme (YggS family)
VTDSLDRPDALDAALAERLARVRQSVADAADSAGRDAAEITTIVVTKFQPASLVRDLLALGVRDVGENRAKEAAAKAAEVGDPDLRWHFVGQLQTNKAKQVRRFASSVHSVDRPSLVDALNAVGDGSNGPEGPGGLDCFIQLALTDDPARAGVSEEGMLSLAEHVLASPSLRLCGVMAVAPLGEDPRRVFARVRRASERLQPIASDATSISAGMSGDYAAAIAEGATHLRIGTAITGKRPERV